MEKHMRNCTSLEVDYDDVFGGPPRFAALISTSHSGTSPSAKLDKVTARASSFRTSSIPVFDLPVFGDDASSRSIFYDARANSNVFDDMFNESGPLPDNAVLSNLYHGSRSKPSSRSSSRRMSPVHPTFASSGQSGGDDRLAAKTRPAVGRLSKRGLLSSASSFDESGGKLADTLLFGTTSDSFSLSVPSSPPPSGSFGRLKSLSGAFDGINVGTPQSVAEANDVFGGYPQRSFSQPFSAVPSISRSHGVKTSVSGKPGLNFLSISDASETFDTVEIALSRSSSIKDGREQREKQVWMAMRTNSSVSGKSELAAKKGSVASFDASLSRQSSSDCLQPPSMPGTILRYKSWKDLVSDLPTGQTFTSRSVHDSVSNVEAGSLVLPTKEVVMDTDVADVFAEKLMNTEAQQDMSKPFRSSAVAQTGKGKSAEYTVEMEERELQVLLANAWKVNEQVEREKYNAKFPAQVAKHSAKETNSPRIEQSELPGMNEKDGDVNWKEWRKYGRGETRQAFFDENTTGKLHMGLKMQANKDAETSQEVAEVIRGGRDEAPKVYVLADGLTGFDSNSGLQGVENLLKGQMLGRFDDLKKDGGSHGFTGSTSQEFLNSDEQSRSLSMSEMEDIESLIASTIGFEEMEGETSERRKLRVERHVRTRKRTEKALEEIQHRDAELQRQEKEKLQFSESSNEKIKRWAAGKEGNLRAFLSNLQHVLWSESGWQPIPLSDLIEVPDVKKAYRKATLFVHPDKMQQKGATVQQKYIAERVFDILQAAWKTFSLQESF